MIVLDTSFLVAFFNEEDELHDQALSDMKNIEKESQIISDYVVLETATVLMYKANLKKAVIFLDAIQNKKNLHFYNFERADFERISVIFKQQKDQISFIDASVIYLALATGAKIATYDKNILKEVVRRKDSKF